MNKIIVLSLLLVGLLATFSLTAAAEAAFCHDGNEDASFSVTFDKRHRVKNVVSMGGSVDKRAAEGEAIKLVSDGDWARDNELNMRRSGLAVKRGKDNNGHYVSFGITGAYSKRVRAVLATITFDRVVVTGFSNADKENLRVENPKDGKYKLGVPGKDMVEFTKDGTEVTIALTVDKDSDVFKIYYAFPPTCECMDSIDNDADAVSDANDPGCWVDALDPQTYDPLLDDESASTYACQDGVDNDNDGLVDYPNDPGCESRFDLTEQNTIAAPQCRDGVDNDQDGLVDLNDPGCSDRNDNDESDPAPLPECSDMKDNDGDGLIDYPNDPGCANAQDNDESDTVSMPQCSDMKDNDGDGLIDFPNDPGCARPSDNDETDIVDLPQCQDGDDNDGDGLIDLADPGCENRFDDNETNAVITPQCRDGADNDGDGLIDLADPGCSDRNDNDEYNMVGPQPQCNDGVDNDRDGLVDLNDPGCSDRNDNDETDTVVAICGNGIVEAGEVCDGNAQACTVGDYDGTAMCNAQCSGYDACQAAGTCGDDVVNGNEECDGTDFSGTTCSSLGYDMGALTCSSTCTIDATQCAYTECNDGSDNDGDMLIDRNDPGCWTDPTDMSTYNPMLDNEGAATSECQDSVDNDGDGAVDHPSDLGCDNPYDYTESGEIGVDCYSDSDCPTSIAGALFCSGDDVYRMVTQYSCVNYVCVSAENSVMQTRCEYGCFAGGCSDYEPIPRKEDVYVSNLRISQDSGYGDMLRASVTLKNTGSFDLDLNAKIIMHDFAIYQPLGRAHLEEGDVVTLNAPIEVGMSVDPGFYVVQLSIDGHADKGGAIHRKIYREVLIE